MKKLLVVFGVLPLLVACGNASNSESAQFDFQAPVSSDASVSTAPAASDDGQTISLQIGEDGNVEQVEGQQAKVEVQPATAPAAQTGVKLNPEHGQPGHRCDIPVGAPLDAAPAVTNAPVTAPGTPAKVQTVPTPSNTPTAGGMSGQLNPAHGQPGHRCDIPVGQPLP